MSTWVIGRAWPDRARDIAIPHLRTLYGRMVMLGASAAELQDIAWVTYLGNVDREQQEEEVSR